MSSASDRANIRASAQPLDSVETTLLVVPWFIGEGADRYPGLDEATGGEIRRALASGELTGALYELFAATLVDRRWHASRLAIVGLGDRNAFVIDTLRRAATAAGLNARQRRADRAAFVLVPAGPVSELAQAAAEGLTLSEFDGATYKTANRDDRSTPVWTIVVESASPAVERAISRGRLLAESSNLAKGLANEPGNRLTPREFAKRASDIATAGGVTVEVLDEERIAELGMGLLLGVARGSVEPPRLMVFRHEPPQAPDAPVLGLVGKGITFDTGGISIKPADGMEKMTDDMAGGAAVACAMRAIAELNAPMRVIGVVPATENMPGGRAIKPGDVIRSAEGKTVEVINTDAEGRLILGDGLWYARKLGATHLVDVATLTGACVVALGRLTIGLYGTPPSWVDQVRAVAEREGDRVWPMPVFDEYFDQLKSEIADFTNTGGRPAGSITAALFLKQFTGGLPWAHLDIAGTAWSDEAKPYQPKGPTGVAVRTLAELAFTSGEWTK